VELLKSALLAYWVPEGRSNDEHIDDQKKSAHRPSRHYHLRSRRVEQTNETIVQKILDELPAP